MHCFEAEFCFIWNLVQRERKSLLSGSIIFIIYTCTSVVCIWHQIIHSSELKTSTSCEVFCFCTISYYFSISSRSSYKKQEIFLYVVHFIWWNSDHRNLCQHFQWGQDFILNEMQIIFALRPVYWRQKAYRKETKCWPDYPFPFLLWQRFFILKYFHRDKNFVLVSVHGLCSWAWRTVPHTQQQWISGLIQDYPTK